MSEAPRRLWVVSELYYPEQTSTGYFLTRIAEGLADDYDVHVICGRPTYSERGVAVARRETRNGTTIHRMRATHFDKDRLALRAVNAITLSLAAMFFALFRFRRGDRLLIVTNPPTLPPIIGRIARLRGVRSLLLVHDVYPDILAATGLVSRGGGFYRLLSRFFSSTYRLYDGIVVLGRDMRDLIAGKFEGAAERIVIIPNWGDADEIHPMIRAENPFAIAHGLVDKTVIQFSGNIGRTHDIELILEAAKRLRDRLDLVFLFVGYGGKTALIEEARRDGGLPNVRFLPRQPREMLGPMLSCSDATIIAFNQEMLGLSVPSRMYNVMAAGAPIIAVADPKSELSLTIREYEAGWCIPTGDADALTALIAGIDDDAAKRGRNGRMAVQAHFTLTQVLDLFSRQLGALGRNASSAG